MNDDRTNDGEPSEVGVGDKKFFVDYCKRASTKCKLCKKNINKGEIRIGKLVPFKRIEIKQFYHL